ncbi:hypothetical protein IFM89_011586 [Coptis chinensis]|uniref:DDT domain-containing protein n=1 Tax=Coptis chinensis TaxID=261450 RepID=A0A835H7J2_9MAGN|nr:hypothetical protein IFM89_011586 [Coptis chinensis]
METDTKRNPSPIRCSPSSKRVKCDKDQVFGLSKTCHQCRQRTSRLLASCKNQRNNNKPCCIKYCQQCLLNRYGEEAEEVVLLNEWQCPKCRDICNCSCCMKKKGQKPTGILVHTAKATGFSSVSDMLIRKGTYSLNSKNVAEDVEPLPKKPAASTEEAVAVSLAKNGKENSFAHKSDPNLQGKACIKEPLVASPGKNRKDNVFAWKSDPNLEVCSLIVDINEEDVGDCKGKYLGKKVGKDTACRGRGEILSKKNCSKQSKVLKEINSNSINNKDVKTEKYFGVKEKIKTSKPSQDVKRSSLDSTKEEMKKGKKNEKIDSQMAFAKEISQKCSKKGTKVVEENNSFSFDEKKMLDNGGTNSNDVKTNTKKNSMETIHVIKENSVRSQGYLGKASSVKEVKFEEEKYEANYLFGMSDSPNSEESSQLCNNDKEGKMVEGNSSLLIDGGQAPSSQIDDNDQATANMRPAVYELKNTREIQNTNIGADIPLPQGIDLKHVAGIDLPAEDVGHALQFLEFCTAFGQFFHLKKGQPESILRELTRGCTRRSRTLSSVVQFHIQLLSLLLTDSGEESPSLSPTSSGNSWLQALGKCISESECSFDEVPSNCFIRDSSGYYILDSSKKLRLLNFLCDEALCTAELRTWIGEQNSKVLEKEKEAKQKVLIAKEKEKQVKQQMQDEMERAIISGDPLTISGRDALVSKMKVEAEKAHAGVLEALNMIPKNKQRSDAVRTEPMFFDGKGHVFWRLKSYSSKADILVQDVGSLGSITAEEKWFAIEAEQKGMVENYISSRGKRIRLLNATSVPTPEISHSPS